MYENDPDIVDMALEAIAARDGITVDELVHYLTFGSPRHPKAADHECGETSLKNPALWCGLPPHEGGSHVPSLMSVLGGDNEPMEHRPDVTPEVLIGVGIPDTPQRHRYAPDHTCAHPDPDHPDRWCALAPHPDDHHRYTAS